MGKNGDAKGVEILSRYIDPDETPIDFHVEILRYWNQKKGDRFAPRWDEITLSDLPPLAIPLITVSDLVKWSWKFGQWSKVYPEPEKGIRHGKTTELYGSV